MRLKFIYARLSAILSIILVIAIIIGINIYISYNFLTVNSYEVKSDKISNSVTICLLADLHDHCFGDKNVRLVSLIQEIDPDLILMAGDFINEESDNTAVLKELIPQLTKIAPVYFSLGNQEKAYMFRGTSDLLPEIKEAGAFFLEETYTVLNVKGNLICLGGMYDYAFSFDGKGHFDKSEMNPDRLQFLEEFQARKEFKIMMSHRPDSFIFGETADIWDIDLVLCGHLHGGQVILPFIGGLYAGDQGFFPKYVYGEYHFNAVKTMIITSGLGSDKERLPRFNNPPEVAVITLEHL